jgi:hypothetical protein
MQERFGFLFAFFRFFARIAHVPDSADPKDPTGRRRRWLHRPSSHGRGPGQPQWCAVGAEPQVSVADGLANLRVTEAIVEVARTGSTVQLDND